jgi:hypothetical protein
MGQRKRLDSLPDVKTELDRMIEENRYSQRQIADFITEYAQSLGYDVTITERIVQRQVAEKKLAREEIKRHQAITKEVVKHLGDISLGDMSKGIAAVVGNLAAKVITSLDAESLKIKDVKELVSISKGMTETAAIDFDLEVKRELHEKTNRVEKIIPPEELDAFYEEGLKKKDTLQSRIAGRKIQDIDDIEPDA